MHACPPQAFARTLKENMEPSPQEQKQAETPHESAHSAREGHRIRDRPHGLAGARAPHTLPDGAAVLAVDAAQAAGEILRKQFHVSQPQPVRHKPSGEVVTDTDLECERVIRSMIRRVYPTHDILGEETGLDDQPSSLRWYVDPIDGTGNFARGNPRFAVSIALADGDTILLGVVLEPITNVLYIARHGEGVWKNGMPLRVSMRNDLHGARIVWCKGHQFSPTQIEPMTRGLSATKEGGAVTERSGSAALACAAVAAGDAAAFLTIGVRPWDIAAGILLVTEAGGRVTDFRDKPYTITKAKPDFLASNGMLHSAVIKTLSP